MSADYVSRPDPADIVPGLERAFMDFQAVEDRLVEGMGVLLRSTDREWAWLHPGTLAMFRQYRPEHVEPVDDRRFKTASLTRAEVSRADEAMGWVTACVAEGLTRRIMGIALMQLALGDRARIEWPAVLRRVGVDDLGRPLTADQVRMRYNRAITAIAERQNARSSAA